MKLLILLIILFLTGCSAGLFSKSSGLEKRDYVAQKTSMDIFWEWGLVRLIKDGLLERNDLGGDADIDKMEQKVCKASWGRIIGSKLYMNKDGNLAMECLYEMMTLNKETSDVSIWFSRAFYTNVYTGVSEGVFHVIHFGDSLNFLESGNGKYHRLSEKEVLKIKRDAYVSSNSEHKPVYELTFPYDDPVYSFSFLTNENILEGYKLLKIEASKLPMESRKYKELKASGIE